MSASPVVTPALRWARSIPPKRAVTASTMPGHSSDRPTSAWMARPSSSPATRSAAEPSRSTTATDAPAAASRVAVARPMPEPPPVTTATLPANEPMASPLRFRSGGAHAVVPASPVHRPAMARRGHPTGTLRHTEGLVGTPGLTRRPGSPRHETDTRRLPHLVPRGPHLRDRPGPDLLVRTPLHRAAPTRPRLPH